MRSLVGEGLYTLEAENVALTLAKEQIPFEKVRAIDKYKVLIMFYTMEDFKTAMNEYRDILLSIFREIRKWTKEETCKVRRL